MTSEHNNKSCEVSFKQQQLAAGRRSRDQYSSERQQQWSDIPPSGEVCGGDTSATGATARQEAESGDGDGKWGTFVRCTFRIMDYVMPGRML